MAPAHCDMSVQSHFFILVQFFRCCGSMYIQDLATGCFTRNNCPKLQWLGKNACLSIVVNAIDNKNLQNTISNYNAEYFKLKKLSEDASIEMLRDEKNNIIEINLMLLEDVKIPLEQFLLKMNKNI